MYIKGTREGWHMSEHMPTDRRAWTKTPSPGRVAVIREEMAGYTAWRVALVDEAGQVREVYVWRLDMYGQSSQPWTMGMIFGWSETNACPVQTHAEWGDTGNWGSRRGAASVAQELARKLGFPATQRTIRVESATRVVLNKRNGRIQASPQKKEAERVAA